MMMKNQVGSSEMMNDEKNRKCGVGGVVEEQSMVSERSESLMKLL